MIEDLDNMMLSHQADATPANLLFDIVKILKAARIDGADRQQAALDSLAKISCILGLEPSPPAPKGNGRCVLARWQVLRLQHFIDSRLDQNVSNTELSRLVRLSASHFTRAFKATFGETPHSYVVLRRVARAKQLLAGSVLPLHEIALSCGFSDQAHFCKAFKRTTGDTPASWRKYRQPLAAPGALFTAKLA